MFLLRTNASVLDHRWRPCRVECTGFLPTSEVKRRRARLVLGWGTAREDLRVLPALSLLQANKKRQCHCHCVVVFKLHGGLYCVVTPSDWFQRCCLRGLCFVLRPELQPAMLVALRASLPPSSPLSFQLEVHSSKASTSEHEHTTHWNTIR